MTDASQGGAALSAEERAELRALCERVRPWSIHEDGGGLYVAEEHGGWRFPFTRMLDNGCPSQQQANAEFAVAARTALPRLLDALERSEREHERLRDIARGAIKAGDWTVDGACDPDLS